MNRFVSAYLIFINLLAFALFGLDKHRARNHAWRIPERTLLFSAVLGGSLGALLGMHFFHHKTKHRRFTLGIPLILAMQIAAAIFLYLR
ncbi:MAG: DUF1294 domain-containing protein [Lachnospiraceae bacterium]|nr:DUF1294 domain-containing protein [Lachnospiraceae bacterium]